MNFEDKIKLCMQKRQAKKEQKEKLLKMSLDEKIQYFENIRKIKNEENKRNYHIRKIEGREKSTVKPEDRKPRGRPPQKNEDGTLKKTNYKKHIQYKPKTEPKQRGRKITPLNEDVLLTKYKFLKPYNII